MGLDDDAPWADLRGNPINARKLASLLKPYGIKSKKVSVDGSKLQGYQREDLWDTWQRYLPPPRSESEEPMEPEELEPVVEPNPAYFGVVGHYEFSPSTSRFMMSSMLHGLGATPAASAGVVRLPRLRWNRQKL